MLKVIYAFFVGILLSIFVGVGISTFYPEPQPPETPTIYTRANLDTTSTEFKEQEAAYNEAQKQYSKDVSDYNRNISIIALVAAVLFMSVGMLLSSKLHVLSDGLLLGGVFTLIYSLFRGFISEENTYRFVIVSIGLVIALVLGYVKFIMPETKSASKKKR